MAINTQKVIVGGIAAGVVVGAIDFVVNGVVLADQNNAAMEALNPALVENMESGGMIALMVSLNLVWGIVLAWTYAAIRPRFGPGPKTAAFAGVQVFCVAALIFTFFTAAGFWGWGYWATGAVIGVVELIIGAQVAAFLYSEDASTPAAASPVAS